MLTWVRPEEISITDTGPTSENQTSITTSENIAGSQSFMRYHCSVVS